MSTTPAPEPSHVANQVYSVLKLYNEAANLGWVLPHGTAFRCFPAAPGQVGVPGAAFISYARMPTAVYTDEGHCPTTPDLVVEVVAPDDRADEHIGKVSAWLAAGVRLVWELLPSTRTVYTMRSDGNGLRLQTGDTLTGEDILPGFTCPVAELFRLPGEPPSADPHPV